MKKKYKKFIILGITVILVIISLVIIKVKHKKLDTVDLTYPMEDIYYSPVNKANIVIEKFRFWIC